MSETMGAKVGALGSRDFVLPFRALGVDTFPAADAQEARAALHDMLETGYAVILVAEDVAPALEEGLAPYTEQPVPCVVALPTATESTGYAGEALARLLKLATGIDIWAAGAAADQQPASDTQ